MSELNHEIDRDNLNKEFVHAEADMAGLRFPSESERYDRAPNAPITTHESARVLLAAGKL